jgi:hypothetical protein
MNAALAPIRDAKTILLTTYKRDGTAVATPVSVAFEGSGRARALARTHRILQAILVSAAHRLTRYHTMHYELVPQ